MRDVRCLRDGRKREVGQADNPKETPGAHETALSAETAEHAEIAERKNGTGQKNTMLQACIAEGEKSDGSGRGEI